MRQFDSHQRRSQRVAGRPPSVDVLNTRSGSLLLEAIIAIGIFSIFLAGIGFSLILGERSTLAGGDRTHAAFLAEEQLEAVRQMRIQSYSSVTLGKHGLRLTGTGWNFFGSSVKANGYSGSVLVMSKGTDWLEVSSTVSWNFGKTRSGSVLLTTQLTNWRKTATVGNWAAMTRINNTAISGTPDLQDIVVNGSYAYITSTRTSGGRGLYIYDISNPASPVRVASTFDLGVSAYGITALDDRLYLATDGATNEVQVYDITTPTTLTTANMINSYDIPGSGRARSIAIYGSNVFVGTLDDPPNHHLYSILMSETGPMTLQDSMSLSGSALRIALQDGYAYITNAYNAAELQVVDVFDPENIAFAPGVGVDMTDVHDAQAIALSGTSALIGRVNGSSIDELTLYQVGSSPVPSPPPGPWTLEIGGDVRSLTTIPGSKYAFVASSATSAQLKVLDLVKFSQSAAPVVNTYNASATMRGLSYNWQQDRLFGVTSTNLMIFSPG